MAKRKVPIPTRAGAKKNNQNNMMKQLAQMQEEMMKTQAELEEKEYSAVSGGGAVEAVVSGKRTLKALHIDPDVVDEDDIEMLEDIIIAAVNEALSAAENDSADKMQRFAGGMNIPGL